MTDFFVKFWGVRGSIACPGPKTIRYGGNTSCLQIQCGEHTLIFDAGTGIKGLGEMLLASGTNDIHLFLSHTHVDHLNGFSFFKPAYVKGNTLNIHAGHLLPHSSVKEQLDKLMSAPLFPVTLDIMAADLIFNDFQAGAVLTPYPGVTIRTAPLNHPNGATGYRIEFNDKSICYVTDTEHVPGEIDPNIQTLIRDADIFIYDSTYTDEEYPNYKGWGHSTWQEGVKLADTANVKTFVVFHHDPDHDDDTMDAIATELETTRPSSVVAKEGLELKP